MTRVLHILPRTPIGGVGSFLKATQSHLSKEFAFDYLIIEDSSSSDFISYVETLGSHVILLNEKLILSNSFRIREKINKIITPHKYKIVHLHSPNIATLVLPICKKKAIPIRIIHSHSTKYSESFLKSIRNYIIERPMFLYATHCIACSKLAGRFLFGNHSFEILYNGIDTKKFHALLQNKDYSKPIIIGHVGNFFKCKNHIFLIAVFEELCKRNSNYQLWLFGDGQLKEHIEKEVRRKKLSDKVIFWGKVNNIHEYYNKIDIFLLPSLFEGFPIAAMEAQAYGIPIIASTKVTNEINFFGDDIFLGIRKKDIPQWIEAIQQINLSSRYEKIKCFLSSKFTIESTTKQLVNFYEKCLKEIK